MTNLFIIGNGFDLAHKMKTSYKDFYDFLIDKYSLQHIDFDNSIDTHDIPYSYTLPDGGEEYSHEDALKAIITILSDIEPNEWKDIENSLGNLPYENFIDSFGIYDEDNDDNAIRDEIYRNEDFSHNLCNAIVKIKTYFYEWIETIKISKRRKARFTKLINAKSDLFLNFNYTKTLEKLYRAENVCHIHGEIGKEIYFGHGKEYFDEDNYYSTNFPGAEYELHNLHDCLKKNTQKAVNDNILFFKKIHEAGKEANFKIYSYGFSFSKPDEYYLKYLCKILPTERLCWYMNADNDKLDKRNLFKKTLVDCGYLGSVSEFYISNKRI